MAGSRDRRRELMEAAYEVVAEGGIDNLSLRGVARRVGATTGLVSHHFLDRSDLLAAALDHAADVMFERIALVDDRDPLALLAAVLPTDEQAQRVWRFSFSVRTSGLFEPGLRMFDRRIRAYWDAHLPARLVDVPAAGRAEAAQHLVLLVDGISLSAVLDPEAWPPARQLAHLRAGYHAVPTGVLDDATGRGASVGALR